MGINSEFRVTKELWLKVQVGIQVHTVNMDPLQHQPMADWRLIAAEHEMRHRHGAVQHAMQQGLAVPPIIRI
jgi:hypothetical protein